MINRYEITKALNQFKRAFKSQISPYEDNVVEEHLMYKLRRHHLKRYSDQELINVTQSIIKSINYFQSTRTSPHKGLSQFTKSLNELLDA